MDLLFAHEDGDPLLSESLDPESATAEVGRVDVHMPKNLADITASANELPEQHWGVVIPDNAEGDRLLGLIKPLVAKRAEDQQDDVIVVRVPPKLDGQAAMDWKKDQFPKSYNDKEHKRPLYLCILGDMDQVSMATQQVLAIDGLPGRLVCPDDDGYEAYVDKVLRWEKRPSSHERPRSLFYTVHDGTASTRSGYQNLVAPCIAQCREEAMDRRYPASRIEDKGEKDDLDPDEFLTLAKLDEPTVLFSLSHGMGPPRRKQWTPDQARQRQGAMVFGSEGAIMPADIAEDKFLPGGLWFYFACFGAGTPNQSAYFHWMDMLAQSGMEGLGNLQALLQSLDQQGGFTSGLAQAALANPNGPLGMLGHVDLAWSYSYEELQVGDNEQVRGTNRTNYYVNLLTKLVKGERLGVSVLNMQKTLFSVSSELNGRYDKCKQRGVAPEGASDLERVALGNLWMRRQDLLGYVLLGDPAVRLPLSKGEAKEGRRRGGLRASMGGGRSSASSSSAPVGADIERHEKAILEYLVGKTSSADLKSALGVSSSDAKDWAKAYQDAGRQALTDIMGGSSDD